MAREASDDGRQGIGSVENAMSVLLAMEQGGGAMTLSQIAAGSEMAPSKTHRYLVSLCRVGLVSQSPTSGLYDLGPAMRRLGAEALRRMDEVGIATEHLGAFRDRTRQTCGLHVWGENGPILVRWINGDHVMPIVTRVGTTVPLATTSAGRVFLAYLPAALTDPVLRAGRKSGQYDIGDSEIEEIKEEVRRTGVAVTTNALVPGISAIAAPVFTTTLPMTVLTGLPNSQLTPARIRALSAELLTTARAISAELGGLQESC
ncbi:MAG: IclR family transcriptional regulator [Sporichthyaceae bacterium]